MTRLKHRGLITLALCAALSGCSTDFPVTPADPAPVTITEEFTGTLSLNGAVTFPFTATTSGQVTATVMSLEDSNGPAPIGLDGPIRIGLALGLWNGTVCGVTVPTLFNVNAFVSTVVTGAVTAAAPLCVLVSDVGKLSESVAFDIQIVHP